MLDAADSVGRLPDGRPEPMGSKHAEVHQATGMIMVQLGVSAATALVRLRAHAYAHERRLRDVASDVVARRLHFGTDQDPAVEYGGDSDDRCRSSGPERDR